MLIFALAYWGWNFLFVFWENWKKKCPFEINWPLLTLSEGRCEEVDDLLELFLTGILTCRTWLFRQLPWLDGEAMNDFISTVSIHVWSWTIRWSEKSKKKCLKTLAIWILSGTQSYDKTVKRSFENASRLQKGLGLNRPLYKFIMVLLFLI